MTDDTQTTHSAECWSFGKGHYECAVRMIEWLQKQNAAMLDQHHRDGRELRSLCAERDEARRERDELRASQPTDESLHAIADSFAARGHHQCARELRVAIRPWPKGEG